jgi:DNA-binding NtrC family response regulator
MKNLINNLRDTQAMASLIGDSPAFVKAIGTLPAIAKAEATVLISGETGTGKELLARAIHYLSKRCAFAFIPVNCGSLTDSLLGDDIFGHERGSFTDAHSRREGLIAQAEKGTLFLDEVDSLTTTAQVPFLRFLQDQKYRLVGSSCEKQADVRIVAATNTSLDQLLRAGTFRRDLYYRLNVFSIKLPPLRDRQEDILALATHFLKKHTPADKFELQLSPSARASLLSYDWPGNVRELENAITRAIHISQSDTIEIEDLGIRSRAQNLFDSPLATRRLRSLKAMKQEMIEAFERDYLTRLMCENEWNVSRAARAAGKERRDLGKLLKKYQLNSSRSFSTDSTPSPQL